MLSQRVRREGEREQRRSEAETARFVPRQGLLTPAGIAALSHSAGNCAVGAVLGRRILARTPEEDAPGVAAKLYGKSEERDIAKALDLLKVAEAMQFYEPVKKLASTGKVLNPEGLATTVKEFHAKSRVKKGAKTEAEKKPHTEGIAAELLHALKEAESGKFVQLGGWRPDHLQTGMAELVGEFPELEGTLKKLTETELRMDQGWGGDVTVWEADGKALRPTTFQHKVIDGKTEGTLDAELRKAVSQLAGQNFERALPGRKVAELLVANEENKLHEWDLRVQMLERVRKVLTDNTFSGDPLLRHVNEVIVSTHRGRATYVVEDDKVSVKSVVDTTDPVKDLLVQVPKEPGVDVKAPPAKHSAETRAYEDAAKARAAADPTQPESFKEAKKWLGTNRNPPKSDDPSVIESWKQQKEVHEKTVAEFEVTRKAAIAEWDKLHPEMVELIAKKNLSTQATTALTNRRKKKLGEQVGLLKRLLSAKESWVKYSIDEESDDTTDLEVLIPQLEKEWLETHQETNTQIQTLESQLKADVWFEDDDPPELKQEMTKIVEAEKELDYVGTGASKLSNIEKQQRQELAKRRGETERGEHAPLAEILDKRLDAKGATTALQKVGAVKHAEGNRAAVGKVVNGLTTTLGEAWQVADSTKTIDVPLLTAATKSLVKTNAGVGYVGLHGELKELLRQSRLIKGDDGPAMIGQWYAFKKEPTQSWPQADAEARKTQNTAGAQEVDVSRIDEAGNLHVSEVAADVDVLDLKVRSEGKKKQRDSYLSLRDERKATITYVVEADRDWKKIFTLGAAEGSEGVTAPIPQWLTDNRIKLVVAGREYPTKESLEAAFKEGLKKTSS